MNESETNYWDKFKETLKTACATNQESLKIQKMEIENTHPRRSRLDLMSPAEVAIYNAMVEIEKAGADRRLTMALIKLDEAKTLVADFIDNVNPISTD